MLASLPVGPKLMSLAARLTEGASANAANANAVSIEYLSRFVFILFGFWELILLFLEAGIQGFVWWLRHGCYGFTFLPASEIANALLCQRPLKPKTG